MTPYQPPPDGGFHGQGPVSLASGRALSHEPLRWVRAASFAADDSPQRRRRRPRRARGRLPRLRQHHQGDGTPRRREDRRRGPSARGRCRRPLLLARRSSGSSFLPPTLAENPRSGWVEMALFSRFVRPPRFSLIS